MTDFLDRAIKTGLDDIVARAPQPGPVPNQLVVSVERQGHRRMWGVPVAAAVVAVIGAAVIGAVTLRRDTGPSSLPVDSAATTLPSTLLPPAATPPRARTSPRRR